MLRSSLDAVLVVGVVSIVGSPARAGDVLIDNLGEKTRDRSEIALGMPLPVIDLWAAQVFTADAIYSLDLIQVILSEATKGCIAVAELRTGPAYPEPLVATFTLSSLPTGPDEIVTLIPDAPVLLVPGETYWLVMGQVEDPGLFKFAYAEGNNWIGPGAFGSYSYSFDQGATWIDFGADNPYQMRVEVSPIVPPACYPDCDGDGALTIDDFICFQTYFAIGDPYADCDQDGVLTIDDFICFQTYFAIGC
jgi:hypothetical protein